MAACDEHLRTYREAAGELSRCREEKARTLSIDNPEGRRARLEAVKFAMDAADSARATELARRFSMDSSSRIWWDALEAVRLGGGTETDGII